MTIEITGRNGTRAEAIVQAIAEGIEDGSLAPGERLPTHRAMARQLGVSLGTVTRAYALAEQRGLIVGEVGRGTFVRHLTQPQGESFQRFLDRRAEVDLSINYPVRVEPIDTQTVQHAVGSIDPQTMSDLIAGVTDNVQQRHQRAGAAWISRTIPDASPDCTLLGTGSVTSVLSILRHLTKPGDMIAVESLTHIQMANIAERLGLRLTRIAMDEHGMVPDALEESLKRESIRAVYCQPTIHCASGATMPESRRDAIAAIIAQHEVPLIEDDEHFGIMREPLRAVCDRLPDLGIFVADLSRAFGLGLRISHLHVPPSMRRAIAQQLIGTVWMVPPLMAEIAARMIEDDTRCAAMIDAHREEIAARHAIADASLERWLTAGRSREAHHVWIELPRPWRAEQFVAAAIGAGVAVTPAEGFVADGSASPNAIRTCLGAARDRETLRGALEHLAGLLRGETIASRGLV